MSYNGSGTFVVNSSGQPVVTGTVISSTAFNALTADLATGLSTAITKDGQTTTTARILFAQGVSSTLVTDATSATTGSIITAGGISMQKALWVGTTSRHVGAATFDAAITYGGVTLSNAVTGTGNMVLSASPTLTGTALFTNLRASSTATVRTDSGYFIVENAAAAGVLLLGPQNAWQAGSVTDAAIGAYATLRLYAAGSTTASLTLGASQAVTLGGALTYGGVTLSNSVTGTGSMVLSASPTFGGVPVAAAFSLTGNGANPTLTLVRGSGGTSINSSNTFSHNSTDSSAITWQINGTEATRITGGRILCVGRTTAVAPSGTTVTGCFASGVSATNGTNSVCMGTNTITFDDSFLFVNNAAGTGVYLANGGTTWTANSDREMKHKIEALNAHDILRAVGDEAAKNGESIAVLYDWKENSDRREAGSIAQNWLVALPAIVEASNPEKLGLMYDRMGAIAAQGVYEQLAINAALEARLAALENK